MLDENSWVQRYNKLPEWVRWVLFLPISAISSIILWFFMSSAAQYVGAFELVLAILHPAVVQALFLALVYYTIPKGKLKFILVLIILRSLFLVFFIASPVLIFFGAEQTFDLIFFKELAGEILALISSVWLYKELREEARKRIV